MDPKLKKSVVLAVASAVMGAAYAASSIEHYPSRSGVRAQESDQHRCSHWLSDCLSEDARLFAEAHLRRPVFDALARCLRERGLRDSHASVEEKLLVFLYICGNGASWRDVKYRCGRSLDTVSRHFHQVLGAVIKLYPEVVQPASSEVSQAIKDDPRRWPAFEDCVGALAGTHLKVHVPASEQLRFRNRFGDLTQNVLAVVDFNMNFTYLLAGWEGSAPDGRVLKDAVNRGFKSPEGRYFLADAGLANKAITLSPYRGVRYHLGETNAVGPTPEDKKELFNFHHSNLRNVIDRTFGVWKRRWRIFDRPHKFPVATQVKLVYALAAIHNFTNKFYPVYDDFSCFEPYSGEEDCFLKDEDSRTFSESSQQMDERREAIANELWKSYCEATGRVYEAS